MDITTNARLKGLNLYKLIMFTKLYLGEKHKMIVVIVTSRTLESEILESIFILGVSSEEHQTSYCNCEYLDQIRIKFSIIIIIIIYVYD